MAKEYEVPVWFKITADNIDDAWWKIRQVMAEAEYHDQLPDYIVEEPIELLTGSDGWNPIPTEDFHAS